MIPLVDFPPVEYSVWNKINAASSCFSETIYLLFIEKKNCESRESFLLRIAVTSDIHSNLEALTTALNFISESNIDKVICLGDIVGYGPDPIECLAMIRERTRWIILGNHDEAAVHPERAEDFSTVARSAIEWTYNELSSDDREFLRSLPYSLSIEDVLYVHSTPKSPQKWEYIFSGFEARLYDNTFAERLCFIGHSHIPGVYSMNPKIREYNATHKFIINVGSIGQPRDGDPRLSFGILDTVAGTYENVRLEYDAQSTAWKILKRGLPRFLAERILIGR